MRERIVRGVLVVLLKVVFDCGFFLGERQFSLYQSYPCQTVAD